jgi:uncharacterized protein (DUF4415 family)
VAQGTAVNRRRAGYKIEGGPLVLAGGAKELAMSIRKMRDEELSKEMKAASQAAAQKIVPHAKRRAPKGKTHKLVGSIKADATRSIARVKVGSPTRVPYARAVHSGRYVQQRGKGFRTRPNPFLREAIPDAWPELVKAYTEGLNAVAEKFNRKHGGHRVVGRFMPK